METRVDGIFYKEEPSRVVLKTLDHYTTSQIYIPLYLLTRFSFGSNSFDISDTLDIIIQP